MIPDPSGFSDLQVMDRNKDGKLMMDEVEQCLIPGTYRYREFHKALKLSTPEAFKEWSVLAIVSLN